MGTPYAEKEDELKQISWNLACAKRPEFNLSEWHLFSFFATESRMALQLIQPDIKYTGYTQKNGAVSKVNRKFISHLTRAQRTPSVAATAQVSHALPAVRFSCLLRGRGASFQDGVAAGKGFLCAPF